MGPGPHTDFGRRRPLQRQQLLDPAPYAAANGARCSAPRGARHAKTTAAYTVDRLRRWGEGERLSLWQSRRQRPRGGHGPRTADQRRDLAVALAREGFEGKACAALLADGLCPETTDTTRALQQLHPIQPPPLACALHDLPIAPDIIADEVGKALRSFPAASAPGPSGLRVQHLRDALLPGSGDSLLQHLTAVVGLLAQGQACPEAACALAGASLVAVPKPKGGIRPIAIGELLRRLTGKCLMTQVRTAAREHLFPEQVGVAVPSGAEAVVHTVRAWLARHSGSTQKVLVKLDFENAFNTLSRQQVLDTVAHAFPELARWVSWCYSRETWLQFGQSTLRSAAGVQQGDPLGPLLFATALQPLAQELRQTSLDLSVFYLDDGVLAGDLPTVAAALQLVQSKASSVGLRLNLAKCELAAVGATTLADVLPHFPQALLFDETGHSKLLSNFELLGAPLGDDDFVSGYAQDRVRRAKPLLEAVALLEDPQVALRLLRACAGHVRLVHTMRCAPPLAQDPALVDFDSSVRGCFSSFTGLHLDTAQWGQASRGFAFGGLGLRSTASDAPAAYLASIGGALPWCQHLDAHYMDAPLQQQPSVLHALEAYNRHFVAGSQVSLDQALHTKQKALTAAIDRASWDQQLGAASLCAQALLRSEAEPGARAFLAALPLDGLAWTPPSSLASFLSDLEFQMLPLTRGAQNVMRSWTASPATLGAASLEVSARFATTRCVTVCAHGLSELASSPRRRRQTCFSPSSPMIPA